MRAFWQYRCAMSRRAVYIIGYTRFNLDTFEVSLMSMFTYRSGMD